MNSCLESKKPWAKTFYRIQGRCNDRNNPYTKRGIRRLITKDELKFLWFRDKAYLMKKPSIDRINSKGHYTLDNCRYIEFVENCREGGISCWKSGHKHSEKTIAKISKSQKRYFAKKGNRRFCKNGHRMTKENKYFRNTGLFECKKCRYENILRWRRKI